MNRDSTWRPRATGDSRLAAIAVSLLCLASLAGFVVLAVYVQGGEVHRLDQQLLRAMRSASDVKDAIGPVWFEEMVRDVTAFGGTGPLAFIVLAVTGYLVVTGRPRTALLLVLVIVGGTALSFGLKAIIARPRPDLVPHGARVLTDSFPSGHATLSTVAYLTLASMLARVQSGRLARVYLVFLGLTIALAVGMTRVYLGVHWPSDVAGGLALGLAYASFAWLLERTLQRRRHIEPAPADEIGDGSAAPAG